MAECSVLILWFSSLLSGESGSGKTFASQLLVRLLFENASHGLLAEPFKVSTVEVCMCVCV